MSNGEVFPCVIYWLDKIYFVQKSSAQSKDNGAQLGRILDSVVQFRNQVRHHALNPHRGDVNAQVGLK
jgi:hypothetical protein